MVDARGTVIYLERLDDARPDASEAAINKARAAAKAGAGGSNPQGAAALTEGGKVIGAVGVSSSANAARNQEIAVAGTMTLDTARMNQVTYISRADVKAGFDRFATIVNGMGYWVITSRRTAAGEAEIHTTDADIMYVVEGSATIVTGGELVEPRNISPIELRLGRQRCADRAGRLIAIHHRHVAIHEHQVVLQPCDHRQCFFPVRGDTDAAPGLLQHALHEPLVDGVVFGHQHAGVRSAARVQRKTIGVSMWEVETAAAHLAVCATRIDPESRARGHLHRCDLERLRKASCLRAEADTKMLGGTETIAGSKQHAVACQRFTHCT